MTESNLDGYMYFQELFAVNFKLKVLLCWKIIFKPVLKLNGIKTNVYKSDGVSGV